MGNKYSSGAITVRNKEKPQTRQIKEAGQDPAVSLWVHPSGYPANSLVHVEEDVSTAVSVSLDSCFLCARHVQVIVGQP